MFYTLAKHGFLTNQSARKSQWTMTFTQSNGTEAKDHSTLRRRNSKTVFYGWKCIKCFSSHTTPEKIENAN